MKIAMKTTRPALPAEEENRGYARLLPYLPGETWYIADAMHLSFCPAHCEKCGEVTRHRLNERPDKKSCTMCAPLPEDESRRIARRKEEPLYFPTFFCALHPGVGWFTRTGKCSSCFTANGSPRRAQTRFVDPARTLAREFNRPLYVPLVPCATHPMAEWWTGLGKCSECFAANGYVRSPGRVPQDPARVEARDAGFTTYAPARACSHHPSGRRYVSSGKCVQCFTSGGARRVGKSDPPRAAARAAGVNTYAPVRACEAHPTALFHTQVGKCSACFNTAGARRPG